jgi:hypothetical protein
MNWIYCGRTSDRARCLPLQPQSRLPVGDGQNGVQPMTASLETTNLVKRYFNICNAAILQKENSLIYNFIINLAKPLASGDNITLKVVDEQEVLLGNYTTYFKEGQFAPVREGIHEPDAQFTLKKSFLEQVSENADEYIAHPEKLDWSWLIQSIKLS